MSSNVNLYILQHGAEHTLGTLFLLPYFSSIDLTLETSRETVS